mgnify:CR=1 FL=1
MSDFDPYHKWLGIPPHDQPADHYRLLGIERFENDVDVISLATVPVILAKGAAYYRDYGVGRSRGTLPFQLAGNIKRGGLIELAFGTDF